jgi:flavin reductase (DIM6/NTAB) family NADH-FMN oxidoreductase RutF
MSSAPQEFDFPLSSGAILSESPFEALPTHEPLDTGELEGDPAIAFRRTMGAFATGVTVITTPVAGQVHGMTANAFMSVSLHPPLVLISIDRRARLCALLHEGTPFGVSVLAEGQSDLSDLFARREVEGVEPRFELVHDTPLVEGAVAHIVAKVARSYWGGDHSLFLGRVEFARYTTGAPLLFHGGRYERLGTGAHVPGAVPPALFEPLLEAGTERQYAEGELIMQRGSVGGELLVVLSGSVRVSRPGRELTLGAGEIVGELEVLSPTPAGRFADIHALEDVRAVVVPRDALLAMLIARPDAALALLGLLADRFRETS